MRIRFISDIHGALNMLYAPTEFTDIMKSKKPADVTLIAGDFDTDIEEAKVTLNNYFANEPVVFVGGNHIVYNTRNLPLQTLINEYKATFDNQWKFLENDYVWLTKDIAVIGTIGWTDFLYGHQTKSQYVRDINREKAYREKHKYGKDLFDSTKQVPIIYGPLPDDPAAEYDELDMGNKSSYRSRRMRDAHRNMNDYNYGKYLRKNGEFDYLYPQDTYIMHKIALKEIKRCYNEIVAKNPNATIILITHHPFTSKCVVDRFKDDLLTPAFVSDHDKWLQKFPNIKYIHCGHVHSRFFEKLGDKQIICNPMGYLAYYENLQDKQFDINYILDI